MAEKLTLFIAERDDFSVATMRFLLENFDLVHFPPDTPLKEILQQVDVFWFRLGYKIDSTVLNQQSKCRYLVTPVTGIDHIDEPCCAALGVEIICLRGEQTFLKNVRATAEHTIALTLALLRNLSGAIAHTKAGDWNRDLFRGHELMGKTVGIVGFGRLGEIVAGYFQCFGCHVGYYDNVPDLGEAPSGITKFDSLPTLLQSADIVSIHVNYNAANHIFFDATCFTNMKPGSILINTARGGLLDETALLAALSSGQLRGAALDVLWGEPAINEHPLIQYSKTNDHLIITPHIGGNTFESFEKTEQFIAQKLLTAISKSSHLS